MNWTSHSDRVMERQKRENKDKERGKKERKETDNLTQRHNWVQDPSKGPFIKSPQFTKLHAE